MTAGEGSAPGENELTYAHRQCSTWEGMPLKRTRAPGSSPAGASPPAPAYAVGPSAVAAGSRIVRLAWSMDDGPTRFTGSMASTLSPRVATWFVMNDQLGTVQKRRTSAISQLLMRQNLGDEIAIHSIHPEEGHCAWFPIRLRGVPQGYTTTANAMDDLCSFASELRSAGVRLHFARMPGGELSEVKKYVEVMGGSTSNSEAVARALLSGRTPPVEPPIAVVNDMALVRSTIDSLGLHLWGGSATGPELTGNTWEAESSGVQARTNDVVRRFKGVVDRLASGARIRPASFVILAHDTTAADVTQAGINIHEMEAYATGKGVRVEYYQLADLYAILRGKAP